MALHSRSSETAFGSRDEILPVAKRRKVSERKVSDCRNIVDGERILIQTVAGYGAGFSKQSLISQKLAEQLRL